MQRVLSPVMKDPSAASTGLKGGLEVTNFLALLQQDFQDLWVIVDLLWVIVDLLFAGHLSRTLPLPLPGLAKAWYLLGKTRLRQWQ